MYFDIVDTMLGINLTDVVIANGARYQIPVSDFVIPAGASDPFVNTVTVFASFAPEGQEARQASFPNTYTDEASWSINLFQPSLTIDLSGDTLSKVGDPLDYTITVVNTSSADSPNLVGTVTDPYDGSVALIDLAPGDTYVENGSYIVPEGAPDPLVMTASVSVSPDGFPNVLTAEVSHTTNLFQPAITIDKSGPLRARRGAMITYTYQVRNTGSADSPGLVNVVLVDDNGTPVNKSDDRSTTSNKIKIVRDADGFIRGDTDHDGELDVGEVWRYKLRRRLRMSDPDPLINTVVVTANPAGFPNVVEATDSFAIDLLRPRPKPKPGPTPVPNPFSKLDFIV
jgi:uncharacterized repeat protein (TIGR01451 family)